MTTPSNNSQMHNDIMVVGSRERPLMLDPCHYAQWSSRFIRYVDTKSNKNELRHCIEQGPYILSEVVHEAFQATTKHPTQPRRVDQETYANTTPKHRKLINVEAQAIHIILNGIGDDIYSTVDACSTTMEMCLVIERLQQGESNNKQDLKTKLFWEFGKFTSRDGESIESYYSRFYKMMNKMVRNKLKVDTMQQQQDLDTDSYHRLFDILKQHQNEVNEIRAEKNARTANPLALVAAPQHYLDKHSPNPYYQAPKPHKTHTSSSRHTTTTSSHASTLNKSKKIAKPVTPSSESASEEDSDPEQAQRDKDMKPKRAKDYAYHKEKMILCKHEEKGVPLSAEHGDWLADTDEEPDEQELEAYYMYMAKIQEQPESFNNTYMMETVDSNVISDSSDMCDNEGQADQNDENTKDNRVLLASLIANFKLDFDENKKSQRQLKKANTSITQELEKKKQDLE
ncbi:hypothetical protein Tco_0471386 [Tanacetum coccineum]